MTLKKTTAAVGGLAASGRWRVIGHGVAVAGMIATLIGTGCSTDSDSASNATASSTTVAPKSTTTGVDRPKGPVADVSQKLSGGNGVFLGEAAAADSIKPGGPRYAEAKLPAGYVQEEFVAAGTASSYKAQGEQGADGKWKFASDATADYRTRVVVRRPKNNSAANGSVVVEWLNVSGGIDANPEWTSFSDELVRSGGAWVGVSTQKIGIEGGAVLVAVPGFEDLVGKGLKALDPARYGTLSHPGDGFSFDIYTQVARAVRAGGDLLGGINPKIVLAAGESQSAIALTTYYNGVQPLTEAFDGFFVHSRGASWLPLVGPGEVADLSSAMTKNATTIFREDLKAPVLDLQAESDVIGVLNSYAARQPDSDTFRLWEVAGTAHVDTHLLGSVAATLNCGGTVNSGPMYLVADAALRSLETWVRDDDAPPKADRLDVAGDPPAIVRTEDGIAKGGVRTPPVDVPAEVLSGAGGTSTDIICMLLGSTRPLAADRMAAMYSSRADYEKKYEEATKSAIDAGFLLEDDATAIAAFSAPTLIG